jgi:hypothetical protein
MLCIRRLGRYLSDEVLRLCIKLHMYTPNCFQLLTVTLLLYCMRFYTKLHVEINNKFFVTCMCLYIDVIVIIKTVFTPTLPCHVILLVSPETDL